MTDYDATAHITEEIRNPEIKAPWAISMAMLFTYLAGFLFNIVLCFVMGDPDAILESQIEQPVAQIFYNVLGKAGGIVFTICAFIILKFVTFTAMQSLARTVFAFSRDRLLPFPNLWTKILPITGTPILAVWISVFWCIAINLIGLGSYAAILGVFNVTAIALDWSYCIPIFCRLVYGRFEPGPWNLGPIFGPIVSAWACIWTVFVSIIFLMPTIRPVTAANVSFPKTVLWLKKSSNKISDELRNCVFGRHPALRGSVLVRRRPQVLHRTHRRGRGARGRPQQRRGRERNEGQGRHHCVSGSKTEISSSRVAHRQSTRIKRLKKVT